MPGEAVGVGNILQFHAFSGQTKRGFGGAASAPASGEKKETNRERREG